MGSQEVEVDIVVKERLADVDTPLLAEALRITLALRESVLIGGDTFKTLSLTIKWLNAELEQRGETAEIDRAYASVGI